MLEGLRRYRVRVDAQTARRAADHIDPGVSVVTIDEDVVAWVAESHLVMHKPLGVVCATRDALERTALDLVPASLRHRDLKAW